MDIVGKHEIPAALNGSVGVDVLDALSYHVNLELPYSALQSAELTVDIRARDGVVVDKHYPAHACSRERLGGVASDSANAKERDRRVIQLYYGVLAKHECLSFKFLFYIIHKAPLQAFRILRR